MSAQQEDNSVFTPGLVTGVSGWWCGMMLFQNFQAKSWLGQWHQDGDIWDGKVSCKSLKFAPHLKVSYSLIRTLQICRFFSPSFGGRMASAFSLIKSRSLYLVIGPMWQKFILLTIPHYSKIDWPMTLFCPRSPPFMSSNGIFLQAKWSKIKERVEGWKSGKKMWFKRITVCDVISVIDDWLLSAIGFSGSKVSWRKIPHLHSKTKWFTSFTEQLRPEQRHGIFLIKEGLPVRHVRITEWYEWWLSIPLSPRALSYNFLNTHPSI